MKQCPLKSKAGMTLIEVLAALLLLSMISLMIGGGILMLKRTTKAALEQAEAQQVLTLTAECLTEELSDVRDVQTDEAGKWLFFSGKRDAWLCLESDTERGISLVDIASGKQSALLPETVLDGRFYTDFESCMYEDACFIVKGLAVYPRQNGEKESPIPKASLAEVVIRAVNLESDDVVLQ